MEPLETARSHGDATGRISLSETQLLEFLTAKAADLAVTRIEAKEERRRRALTIGLGLLSLLGAGGIYALINEAAENTIAEHVEDIEEMNRAARQQLIEEVETRISRGQELANVQSDYINKQLEDFGESQANKLGLIETAVARQVKEETGAAISGEVLQLQSRLEQELALQRLTNYALELDIKPGFSAQERDTVMRLLRSLAETDVVQRFEFPSVLARVVESFHSADQQPQIDELDSLMPNLMMQDDRIAEVLIGHYGQRVVGSARPVAEMPDLVVRFRRYLSQARRLEMEEIEVLWEVLLSEKQAAQERYGTNRRALASLAYLDIEDRVFFFLKLLEYSVPGLWVTEPTYVAEELGRVAEGVRSRYTEELRRLYQTLPLDVVETELARRLMDRSIEPAALEATGKILSEWASHGRELQPTSERTSH